MPQKALKILTLILILGSGCFAQNDLREVKWDDNRFLLHAKAHKQLPVFSEQIPFYSIAAGVKVKLLNTTFEQLSATESAAFKNLNLQHDIQIHSEVKKISQKYFLYYEFTPLRMNPESKKIEKLMTFDLSVELIPEFKSAKSLQFKQQSVLANGRWFKFMVSEDGVYKISYNDLAAMGMDLTNIDPRDIRIYGNGGGMLPENNSDTKYDDLIENAIVVSGEIDGSFDANDYILFYGQSPHTWTFNASTQKYSHSLHAYSEATCYFITADLDRGKRITQQNSLDHPPDFIVTEFQDHVFHERDEINLINSGRNWYGEVFDATAIRSFDFSFPNLIKTKEIAIQAEVALRSSVTSKFDIEVNGVDLNQVSSSGINFSASYPPYARTGKLTDSFLSNNENIELTFNYNKPNASSKAWLDNIELTAWRKLKFESGQMTFRNAESISPGSVSEFKLNGVATVWNVTDPMNVKSINGNLVGNEFSYVLATDSLLEFIAFDDASFLTVEFIEEVANQNYHALESVDYIIVSPAEFYSEAMRLAEFHANKDGLSFCIVEPQKIYNEFSSGAQDISAIRNFVRMLYERADPVTPKYLLLFGDASFDYKDRVSENTNFVPTWESPFSTAIIVSYNTDDYYGLLDEDEGANVRGGLDIGIGRIPVKTLDQARKMVDKIIHYADNLEDVLGAWRNTVCLVGDDQDYNTYVRDSEQLGSFIKNGFNNINIDKVYFDAYPQVSTPGGQRYPEVKKAINEKVEKGALIVNYIGHGGETGWAHERVLEIQDINAWQNYDRLPVFVTATCEFTRFDDPELESAGELVLLNENGGGIALLTTTRATSAGANFQLNKQVFNHVFEKRNGSYLRLGDIIKESKNAIGNGINAKKFVLVGDPALKIALPKDSIATLEINNQSIQAISDTLNAMERVTIGGSVFNKDGSKNSSFNGSLYPIVYDKPTTIKTLGQDNDSYEQEFNIQSNILYKGKVSVQNGDFNFSFVVPKDIAYNYGFGKISYYAHSEHGDAWGCYENLVIGGYNDELLTDTEGPTIQLFINNELFRNGGVTDQNPKIFASISDESGINTVGNGIGHDIVASIDGDIAQTYVLNDFYESDLDSHTSGTLSYALSGLSQGKHTLSLKVWDILNNSSSVSIEFEVVNQEEPFISDFKNFPNPFTHSTSFSFEHNQANSVLNFEIQVFSLDGKKVKTIRKSITPTGYHSGVIYWDATTDGGKKLDAGIYIYRILIEGHEIRETESKKLIIVK